MNKWMWIVGSPALIAGCAISDDLQTGKAPSEPLALTAGVRVAVEGILSYGAVAFAENPTTLLEANDFHGYEFDGKAGGNITITMNGSSCGAPDTLLDLFSPEDASENRAFLVENDDANLAPCTLDARIANFTLPTTGRYLIVATSFLQAGGNGHYKLQLTCNNNACVDPAAPTFAASQISQASIDAGAFTPAQLFDIGDFTFEHMFTVPEGLGNALLAAPANNTPRPNFRQFPNNVHFAAFGAPEAQSCVSCHNIGGDDGAGDNNHNIFQIGDGINRASGVPRNPPPVLGSGLRQRIGEEMTAELQGQLASGKAQAIATNSNVTVQLRGKGRNFGSVVAKPDGTVDFTLLNPGIDSDLVVKPFGWKGREATIRRFIEGGFRVHFGMQTAVQVTKQCPNTNLLGTGACPDPDGDGVINEITEGLLSAEAVYMGLLETPVRVPAPTAAAQLRVNQGETLFNQVGCAGCHTQNLTINNPIHTEPGDFGGAGITVNLATDTKDPHPALNADGTMTVEIWSDFKRHNMGSATDQSDCDSKDFNQINKCFFMTPPLWGIRNTAPYLHDGRAATLLDSVILHGAGDDAGSVAAFKALSADDQSKIVEFMNSLGRQEDKDAAPVDLGNFRIEQTGALLEKTIPAGTTVPHGGFLIVGRNATQAQFEANYGVTLGPTVTYLNGGNAFPIIDGGETFTLFDTQSVLIDGRSIAEPVGGLRTFSRVRCDVAPSLATSWSSVATSNAAASPGRGPLPTGQNRICVTEVADSANTNFEYVEIFVE